tara:strand:+ start:128 stop:445 length:318 start_codon:yes stop_codon:yes gene_type:complete
MLINNWEQTYWEDEQGNRTTIQEVLEDLRDEPVISLEVASLTHLRRTTTEPDRKEEADLSFPIIVTKSDGKLQTILDGNHRLQKTIDNGETYISAKILKDSGIDQ